MSDTEKDYIPIPEIFWSWETGKPFERCIECEKDLRDGLTSYFVEKAFRRGEVVFECAMCYGCAEKLQQEFSSQSKKLICNYFDEHVDPKTRYKNMFEIHGNDYKAWLNQCVIKNIPFEECDEYQVYGCCMGGDLVFNGAPYMLSDKAIEDIVSLLSNETLGVLDKLTDKYFGIDMPKGLFII